MFGPILGFALRALTKSLTSFGPCLGFSPLCPEILEFGVDFWPFSGSFSQFGPDLDQVQNSGPYCKHRLHLLSSLLPSNITPFHCEPVGVSNGTPHCTASKSNLTLIWPKVGERQGNWRQGTNLKRIERQQLTSVNTPVQCSSRINLSKLLVADIVFYYHLITTTTSGTRLPLSIHSLQGLPSPIKPLPPRLSQFPEEGLLAWG